MKKKPILKPRTKEELAQLDADMRGIAQFLFWKRKYYAGESNPRQDLIDLGAERV